MGERRGQTRAPVRCLKTGTPSVQIEEIQAPVLRRRPAPYYGCHVLLHVDDAVQGRALLNRLIPYIASAADYETRSHWAAIAFTYSGLQALGVPNSSLDSFPIEFRQGMASRAAMTADTGENSPEHWQKPYGTGDVHIAVTFLSVTDDDWRANQTDVKSLIGSLPAISLLITEEFAQTIDARTPLGYKDGISFPHIAGNVASPIPGGGEPIALGEFVLGYPSETGIPLPMPQPEVLGRNGTFVGFRKLHSNVAKFRRFLKDNATSTLSEELIAAKMAGRWRSGAPLALSPDTDDPELGSDLQRVNDFGYSDDPSGLRCPLGAHVRRMNPRDRKLAVMSDVKIHRVIRHGMTYGPHLPEGVLEDDGVERGIFFIFISARAPQTFEFLKKEWINNGNFMGLSNQKDPIAGRNEGTGTFTIPMRPIRKRLHGLDNFTQTRGGEYAFMPGLAALRWLIELSD